MSWHHKSACMHACHGHQCEKGGEVGDQLMCVVHAMIVGNARHEVHRWCVGACML